MEDAILELAFNKDQYLNSKRADKIQLLHEIESHGMNIWPRNSANTSKETRNNVLEGNPRIINLTVELKRLGKELDAFAANNFKTIGKGRSKNFDKRIFETTSTKRTSVKINKSSNQKHILDKNVRKHTAIKRNLISSKIRPQEHRNSGPMSNTINYTRKKTLSNVIPILKQCSICEYSTKRAYSYIEHMKLAHNIIKPYKCDECQFSAKRSASLKRHKGSMHLKTRAYMCDQCSYSASRRDNLKQHIKAVHYRIRNFRCGVCKYSASIKSDLKRHTNAIHLKISRN